MDGDGYIDVEELKKLFSVSIEDQGGKATGPDADPSGTSNLPGSPLMNVSSARKVIENLLSPLSIDTVDVTELFLDLDTDGSGKVDLEEFLDCFLHLADHGALRDRRLLCRIEKLASSVAEAIGVAERRGVPATLEAMFF